MTTTPATDQTAPPATHRKLVTGALLLAMFMAAIEGTIVATAMPRIVAELGGFSLYSWVFSAYLLTQVVSIPIYGKLADLYGRKPIFTIGVVIFLVGSVLCGQAHSMIPLILFRALQGLGSGAVQPIAITVVGDLYGAEERHRVQGWMGSVWAISAIVGPALGGFIVDYASWPWIFYLNIPLGLLAMAGVLTYLHEQVHHRAHRIDVAGALLLVLSVGALMMGLLQGGTAWAWTSVESIGLFVGAIAAFLVLLVVEGRAAEPILPLALLRQRLIAMGGGTSFFHGVLTLGLTAMIPTFVQGVQGGSALVSGMALAAMSIGWPLASFLSGRVMRALGYRKMTLLGTILTVVGTGALILAANVGALAVAAAVFVLGMGLGFTSNALIITVQSAVAWQQRGVATANLMFMRSLGSTVGVAAFGAVLNVLLLSGLQKLGQASLGEGGRAIDAVNRLLAPGGQAIAGAARADLITALDGAMHGVFVAALIVAIAGLVFAWWLPHEVEAPKAEG